MSIASSNYCGKKVAVLGLGRSGMAASRLLKGLGAEVTVCDSGASAELRARAETLCGEGINFLGGMLAENDPTVYDLAVLSPGIEESSTLVTNITTKGTPLIGELELAFTCCKSKIIAITGSNGKTTTTELTAMALAGAGLKAVACGNIGIPFSEIVASRELWDVVVIEVSSFQLETIRTFRPQIAVWLNLTPNHLDRYPSMEEYRSAKLRIFENQQDGDWAVVPSGETMPKIKSRPMTFGVGDQSDLSLHGTMIMYRGEVLLDMNSIKLRGDHNALNLMAAFACGLILGADPGRMAASIAGYTPPAHRCELVLEGGGVKWINDSKATTLAAMEQAIRSVQGPLLLIAGGKDKGFTFAPIAPLVRERVDLAILIGEMRHRIAADWASTPTIIAESLDEAVEIAAQKAPPGGTILFSPGTSSFDMFRDYIDRGESFRRLVMNSEHAVISTS